ncbi:MAG TPA: bifunctional nuclease family protein [Motilibacterales bacterium]|nr:bifunctional nuclease family protein [Motilibacterales bacterium]
MPSNAPIVLVRPITGGALLPIWIGPNEAAAIAMAQQGVAAPRPLTHDLFIATLLQLGTPLLSVRITRLEEGVFFAELVFAEQAVDARPSDAIALALRAGVPIMLSDEVLAEAGVAPDPDEDVDEVEQFREFLDTVTPQDFQ